MCSDVNKILMDRLSEIEKYIRERQLKDEHLLSQFGELRKDVEKLKDEKVNKDDYEVFTKKLEVDLEMFKKAIEKMEKRESKVEDTLLEIKKGQDKLFKYGFAVLGTVAVVSTIFGNITGTKIDVVSIFLSLLGLGGQ